MKELEIITVCAFCNRVIYAGGMLIKIVEFDENDFPDERVSYGICNECLAKQINALKKLQGDN